MLIQNTLGVIVDSKKYTLFFWSATVLHRVEEILGCAGVEIPRGTDTISNRKNEVTASLNVCGKYLFNSSKAGFLVEYDFPKSP